MNIILTYFSVLSLILIIGSTTLSQELYLFLALSCLAIIYISKGNIKISKDALLLGLLFIYSILFGLVMYLMNWDAIDNQIANYQFFAIRKGVIDFVIGISVYIFLNNKDFNYTINLLSSCFLINSLVLFMQFLLGTRPPSALFYEPSSLAYFSISFFIVFYYFFVKQLHSYRAIIMILTIFSLMLTNSKIYYLYIFLLGLYYLFKKLNFLIFTALLIISILIIYRYLGEYNSQISSMLFFFPEFLKDGIYALNSDSGVFGTFITRLSSIFIAFVILLEYPFGIGIGIFPYFYLDALLVDVYSNIFYGSEINRYIDLEFFPSAKSALLTFLLGSGLLGLIYILYIFFKCSKKHNALLYSFLTFLFASFFLELNNFYIYFYLFLILIAKYKSTEEYE